MVRYGLALNAHWCHSSSSLAEYCKHILVVSNTMDMQVEAYTLCSVCCIMFSKHIPCCLNILAFHSIINDLPSSLVRCWCLCQLGTAWSTNISDTWRAQWVQSWRIWHWCTTITQQHKLPMICEYVSSLLSAWPMRRSRAVYHLYHTPLHWHWPF